MGYPVWRKVLRAENHPGGIGLEIETSTDDTWTVWPSAFDDGSVVAVAFDLDLLRRQLLEAFPDRFARVEERFDDVCREEGPLVAFLRELTSRVPQSPVPALGRADLASKVLEELTHCQWAGRDEPFFATARVQFNGTGSALLHYCRGYTPSGFDPASPEGMFVNWNAELGRILPYDPPCMVDVEDLPAAFTSCFLIERAIFRPTIDAAGYLDAADYIYLPDEPVRRFLSARLLLKSSQIESADRLRPTATSVELPDLLVMSREQDRLARLPLSTPVLFTGPAGSGKTTALLKRLALKTSEKGLTQEEKRRLPQIRLGELGGAAGWLFFTRTSAMVKYLRKAFQKEGLDSSRNVADWDSFFRVHLRPALEEIAGRPILDRESGEANTDTTASRAKLFRDARRASAPPPAVSLSGGEVRLKSELKSLLKFHEAWIGADARPRPAFSKAEGLLLLYGILLQERTRTGALGWVATGPCKRITQWIRPLVLVDEAAEFSPLELACMELLTLGSTGSFSAAGDPDQTVSPTGSKDWESVRLLIPELEVRELASVHRQTAALRRVSILLARNGRSDPSGVSALPPAEARDASGPPPVSAQIAGGASGVASWILERLREIDAIEGELPSTAVIVRSEPACEEIASALKRADPPRRDRYEACADGIPRNERARVRIVAVDGIRGLEFESAFVCNVHEWRPEERWRVVYVAMTRARRYAGISFSGSADPGMMELLKIFPSRDWRSEPTRASRGDDREPSGTQEVGRPSVGQCANGRILEKAPTIEWQPEAEPDVRRCPWCGRVLEKTRTTYCSQDCQRRWLGKFGPHGPR